MDDDSVSVQSQETDKQPDTPSSLSKSSNDSKESTPQPLDDVRKKDSKENSVDKEIPEQEKKVSFRFNFSRYYFSYD